MQFYLQQTGNLLAGRYDGSPRAARFSSLFWSSANARNPWLSVGEMAGRPLEAGPLLEALPSCLWLPLAGPVKMMI